MKIRYYFTFFLITLTFQLKAQVPNHSLYKISTFDSTNLHKLDLAIDYFGFSKNNEYSNEIADGYTLFGNQVNTTLVYFPTKNIRLEGGVFLWQDFGTRKLSQIQPYFQFKFNKDDFSLLFGNLEGNLTHGLIEPLFDFEKVMLRPLENGFQVKLNKEKFQADVWADWVTMIYNYSPYREQINGGVSLNFNILKNEKIELSVPVQFTGYHLGGQIDATDLPVVTSFNGSVGFKLNTVEKEEGFVHQLSFENHLVLYTDYSFSYEPLYDNGAGVYLNLMMKSHLGYWQFSYWNGNKYTSPLGGALYSSESKRIAPEILGEPKRQLLIFRSMNDITLGKGFKLLLRAEPYYDLNNKRFEFNTGFYLKYNLNFNLATIKNQN
jgi:hypothetical protein